MNRKNETVRSVVLGTVRRQPLLCTALVLAVAGAVAASLLPPLVLGRVVDRLTARQVVPFALALGYFGLLALSGGLESLRESLLTVFGQKMTHALRSAMCAKLDKLPAEAFVNQESGAAVSRFVGDVDTVEELFTAGIISMFADACRLCGILAVIFAENRGLALILLVVLPLLYLFTRVVQKRMLKAQLQNRAAVARASAHVPETLRCIRTIHTLRRENYMEKAYDVALDDSFAAVEKTNFYDACYSPVILIMNAAVVALVMLLSAAGSPEVRAFFGMSVGTAVAVIAYISQVFTPLESIGMEIETIQSAVAGVRRIDGFLAQAERIPTAETAPQAVPGAPSVELQNVHFGYESDEEVLHGLSFAVQKGEQVTLTGRTGAGKSTIFKLLLGLYRPQQGKVMLNGVEAATLPDTARRPLVAMWSRASAVCRAPCGTRSPCLMPPSPRSRRRMPPAPWACMMPLRRCPKGTIPRVRRASSRRGSGSCFPSRAPLQPGRKSCCWMKLPQTWTPEQNRLFWMLCSAPVRTAPWFPSATGCTTAPAGEALRSDTDHLKHRKKSNF